MDDGFTTFMISISGVILLFMNWMSFIGWVLIIIAVYLNMIYIARAVKQSQTHMIPMIMVFLSIVPLLLLFVVSPQMFESFHTTTNDVKLLVKDMLSIVPEPDNNVVNTVIKNNTNKSNDSEEDDGPHFIYK